MARRILSALFAFVFILSVPLNVLANTNTDTILQLSSGINSYAFSTPTLLTEIEIDRIRTELASKYSAPKQQLIETVSAETRSYTQTLLQTTDSGPVVENERFRIYPIVTKQDGIYTFKGIFVGGNVIDADTFTSLAYQLEPGSHAPILVEALDDYQYPDSSAFGYDHYNNRDDDNWQSTALLNTFDRDAKYYFALLFETNDTEVTENSTAIAGLDFAQDSLSAGLALYEGDNIKSELTQNDLLEGENTTEAEQSPSRSQLRSSDITDAPEIGNTGNDEITNTIGAVQGMVLPDTTDNTDQENADISSVQALGIVQPELISESFLIYTLKTGDTLMNVSNHYGVPLSTIIQDNRLIDTLLRPGDELFLRNPVTEKPLSDSTSVQGTPDAYFLGKSDSTMFAYSLVNFSTGNLFYSSEDITLDEYMGFSINRYYNSHAAKVSSLFGYGFATNLGMRLSLLDDGSMLFTMEDGKEIILTESNGDFFSQDKKYHLTTLADGFEITDNRLNTWTFNQYGQIVSINDKYGLPILLGYDVEQRLSAIISSVLRWHLAKMDVLKACKSQTVLNCNTSIIMIIT